MDSQRRSSFQPAINLFVLAILLIRLTVVVQGGAVLRVKPKFGAMPADLARHDDLREARRLSGRAIDLPLGGSIAQKWWYADIALGTPPKHFQVQIDTGSDVLWVHCEGCDGCSQSTGELKMETYNPELSKTARFVTYDERLCSELLSGAVPKISSSGICEHEMLYGDGTFVRVYFVTDLVSFGQVSSNPNAGLTNVTFGCTTKKVGRTLGEDLKWGVDGLIGFQWSEKSIFYQMASSGRVRKEFAHCLGNDGGIFAIGHVVKPKLTTMTPLLPEVGVNYQISVTAIEVGGHFHIHQYRASIDTGCTVNILPKVAYDFAIEKIFLKHPNLEKMVLKDGSIFFPFPGSVDVAFPTFTYQVNMSHAIEIYPHDYFIPVPSQALNGLKDIYTVGFVTQGSDRFVLGDVALRNKLFVYDLENKQIGWLDYNCSSSIELEDEDGVCNIGAHNITGHPN